MVTEYTFSEFGRKGAEVEDQYFEDVLKSDQSGNEGNPTPADPTPAGNEGQPATPPADDDIPQSVRDYLAQNPDHAPIVENLNRQFKAAFTPRLQEAADLRKQFEGIDPNVIGAVRHLQQLIQTDPRNAAEYLRQQAQLLEGAQNPEAASPPANAFDQYEPATEVEALLLRQVQELNAWKEQQTAQFQQVQRQQQVVQINADFAKLEQELGVQVPVEQRAAAWELSEATQGRMSVTDAFFALNRNTLLPSLLQKARDEASGVVQRKAGETVPGSLATRSGPAPDTGPKDFDTIYREMSGG